MQAICLGCQRKIPLLTTRNDGQYACECGTLIPYKQGIYQFVREDEFYEGKFTKVHQPSGASEKLFIAILRLASIAGNEERMWRRSTRYIKHRTAKKKLEILNIGAGGGHGFLKNLGLVTAIDLSFGSLVQAQKLYDFCYQADARKIPFPDESFDLVFSSHLLGHIPLQYKQGVIQEIYRVTKVKGFSLHSAECEADNFVYTKAKRYPELYKKYFQDMYGHYGLEYPSACKKRFRDVHFLGIIEASDYCKGIIRPAASYKVFFGAKEFREKAFLFNLLATGSEILALNRYLAFFINIFLYPFTVLNRLGGPDSVDSIKLLYQKNL